jgi:hypothetical protein
MAMVGNHLHRSFFTPSPPPHFIAVSIATCYRCYTCVPLHANPLPPPLYLKPLRALSLSLPLAPRPFSFVRSAIRFSVLLSASCHG